MKKLIPFIFILLFVSDCTVHRKATPSNTLFSDINTMYDFHNYNIALRTDDNIYYLTNPKIQANGDLKAEVISICPYVSNPICQKTLGGKEMRFISKKKSYDVAKNNVDSVGAKTNSIQFSQEKIWGVDVLDTVVKPGRHLVYKHHNSPKKQLISILLWIFLGVAAFFTIMLAIVGILTALSNSGACYIATMVYGSYDAHEVLVLRKFRDEKLQPYFLGRLFIKTYYTFSPTFVFIFKNNKPVNKFIKVILDRWVQHLTKASITIS